MLDFIKGRELSRHFYEEVVGPILSTHFGDIRHTACLMSRVSMSSVDVQ